MKKDIYKSIIVNLKKKSVLNTQYSISMYSMH